MKIVQAEFCTDSDIKNYNFSVYSSTYYFDYIKSTDNCDSNIMLLLHGS